MPLFRPAPIRLQPYFGYRSRTRLKLQARALSQPQRRFEPGARARVIRTMLAQFASREVAGVHVTLRIERQGVPPLVAQTVSDPEGFIHFDLPLEPAWDLPRQPAWESAELSFIGPDGPQCFAAHVLAPGLDSRLAVISDIDDTIIETGITAGWRSVARNWRRLIAQLPGERLTVPGADAFYDALGGGEILPQNDRPLEKRITATRRPFFYVSSSPWNLFAYLVTFQRSKGLPLGPLLLRDWGLDRATFGSASHGVHKRDAINAILTMYPELRFALIGDDTQGDLPAYAEAVEAFPGRIAAVFLRTADEEAMSASEIAACATIRAAGVALWLGDSFTVGAQFLQALGFTPGGETEQIVKAVEEPNEKIGAAQKPA